MSRLCSRVEVADMTICEGRGGFGLGPNAACSRTGTRHGPAEGGSGDRSAPEADARGLRPMVTKRKERIKVTPRCGNVFADIGLPEPEEALARAQLAAHIEDAIKRRRL